MKKLIAAIVLAAFAGGVLGAAFFGVLQYIKKEPSAPETPSDGSLAEEKGCRVEEFFAYSGEYPEDGSFEPVENVAAIRIKNTSSVDIRYADITVKTETGEYVFLASSWLAGTEMTVLESTGKKTDGSPFVSAEITSLGVFENAPSLLEDRYDIQIDNGVISVTYKTEADVPNGVTVYFKLTDENGFFGGMTFRAVLPEVKAGETQTVPVGIVTEKEIVPVFAEEN